MTVNRGHLHTLGWDCKSAFAAIPEHTAASGTCFGEIFIVRCRPLSSRTTAL